MQPSLDPVKLEIYRNLFTSVPEEMGTVLRRTAYSPNIKERRDYSCALFDGRGQVVAMGDHMPVHLGSMPLSVQAALEAFPLRPGDVAILNDPFCGGTHLPDITLIASVYERSDGSARPLCYLACRAHHSDVGGMTPGSMPLSTDIFQEGFRIPPMKLYGQGKLNRTLLRLLLCNVRTPLEREGDLAAQVGGLKVGERRILALAQKYGREELEAAAAALQDYAERVMTQVISQIPEGHYSAEDCLDDDGVQPGRPVTVRVGIQVSGGKIKIDFTGSDPAVQGSLNAVPAIIHSAVYYVLRCLAPPDVPSSAGLMRPLEVNIPRGCVLNADFPAATAGGNVETSQRVVDVLLAALAEALPERIPAASSGTMNNLSLGGREPRTGLVFSYYETVAGGMGASPSSDGDSGVHTHMTNSLNTPIEALERELPVRVREYRLRPASGGRGRFRGGDGIIRSLEALEDLQVTLLSDRRVHRPFGLQGGEPGRSGRNSVLTGGKTEPLPGKVNLRLKKGETLCIETPGGGGWGTPR